MDLPLELRNFFYLVAAVLFIFGIKGMTHPRTAVRGNMLGSLGMLVAIVVTLIDQQIVGWWWILAGMAIGATIGLLLATRVQMTAMPELVALLNGFGGSASTLVAAAAVHESIAEGLAPSRTATVAVVASGLIGSVTVSGSVVAWGKLQDIRWFDRLRFAGQRYVSAALALSCLGLGMIMLLRPEAAWAYWVVVLVALALGVLLVTPIGGADMPVVISLLNSYSGLAAAATGFVIGNSVLIISGSLVGASGMILTQIMCKAMNRSLANVLFGGTMGESGDGPSADDVYAGRVKSTSPEEVAMLFDGARKVVIVPGYGLAVSQAQHIVRELSTILEGAGTDVEFGIHPVAGRMPGHMNVLLAEADIPYDKLREMDLINPEMEQVDVAMVIGANDVVNPLARTDPASPIAGMPIINVDKARTVVVVKRSLSPGFAGIPNPLFAADNCLMLFGDGKKALQDVVTAIQEG